MANHRVFRPMVCLEMTRTKTEMFNRVILKQKEQLAGWPMGFVGPATGQSRVESLSGLSRRSRSTAVAAASIGRPGDALHCCATGLFAMPVACSATRCASRGPSRGPLLSRVRRCSLFTYLPLFPVSSFICTLDGPDNTIIQHETRRKAVRCGEKCQREKTVQGLPE